MKLLTAKLNFFLIILLGLFSLVPLQALAEAGLTLSVQPPLFQVNLGPGEHWASSVKVENKNNLDQTFFASVLNFQLGADKKQNALVPVTDESNNGSGYNLAQWVEISKAPITVKHGASVDIPFSLNIPKDAAPGDHYAAIIVGTVPSNSNASGTNVSVAAKVSSLLFVRVRGNVLEQGDLREFRSSQSLYQTADAELIMRMENNGNVRIKPEGQIDIYNMWGKLRGSIPINEQSGFGNVLPSAVKQSVFSWSGERNLFEIGPYRAKVTLFYGDPKRTITAATTFWVLPIISTSLVLGILLFFLIFTIWTVRRFVRRSLRLELERWQTASKPGRGRKPKIILPKPTLALGIGSSIILSVWQLRDDFKKHKFGKLFWSNNSHTLLVITAIILIVIGFGIYFGQTLKASRTYQGVIYKDDGRNLRVNNGHLENNK